MPGPLCVAELIDVLAAAFEEAGLCFGHGTMDARDEAAALIFHVMGLDHAQWDVAYRCEVPPALRARIDELARRRIDERRPLPYLLGEAWFAGLPFHVDERVLVPRSPFAELITDRFAPWLDAARVGRILEIGTGSGCIAVACAYAFPGVMVDATDISAPALEVAARNVERHGVEARVRLIHADLYGDLQGPYDLIVSNPPYVPSAEVDALPPEYVHEPRLGLESGADGMETPARILQHAAGYLAADGWLALEVGEGAARLEERFPTLPFIWPDFTHGGDGIALVSAAELARLAG